VLDAYASLIVGRCRALARAAGRPRPWPAPMRRWSASP
jgi:hypothetical protein